MKIAIDLNDVIRDFSNNFLRYYCEGYDHTFNPDGVDFWSNDMMAVFPFKSNRAYEKFLYDDFAFELFGKCEVCTRNLASDLSVWMDNIRDIDTDEPIDVMIVSSKEYAASIGYSYFFISKLGPKVREVYFPSDSSMIWDRCDVLITANPDLLKMKAGDKISIKIDTDYNKEIEADYKFKDLKHFLDDINNTERLVEKWGL